MLLWDLPPQSISIHAPREGGDPGDDDLHLLDGISIHAPREGGDEVLGMGHQVAPQFQSTPPARGATAGHRVRVGGQLDFNPRPPRGGRQRGGQGYDQADNFNPRPPRGGRRAGDVLTLQVAGISIHAPREGGDPKACCRTCASFVFQSTPPARGATARLRPWRCAASDFNPRPPRGGRPAAGPGSFRCLIFQSTPPARGAT